MILIMKMIILMCSNININENSNGNNVCVLMWRKWPIILLLIM